MSDPNAHRPNLNLIADAQPTQPQSPPEAPTLKNVQIAGELLIMFEGDEAVHELYSHFKVKSADDWRRKTGMSLFGWLKWVAWTAPRLSSQQRRHPSPSSQTAILPLPCATRPSR